MPYLDKDQVLAALNTMETSHSRKSQFVRATLSDVGAAIAALPAIPLDDCGPLCPNKDTLRESCDYHSRRVEHFVHAVLDVLGRDWCDDEWMSDAEITDELKAKVAGALPVLETPPPPDEFDVQGHLLEKFRACIDNFFVQLAEGGTLAAIESIADFCSNTDYIDDEQIELYERWASSEEGKAARAPVEPVPQKRCDNRYMSISGATVRCIGVEGHDDLHVYRLGDRDAEVEPVPAPTESHIHEWGDWQRVTPPSDDPDYLFNSIPSETRSCMPCGLNEIRVLEPVPAPRLEWVDWGRSFESLDMAGEDTPWSLHRGREGTLGENTWTLMCGDTILMLCPNIDYLKDKAERLQAVLSPPVGPEKTIFICRDDGCLHYDHPSPPVGEGE